MLKIKAAFILLGVSISVVQPAMAQDSHYWTHQYGTRSNLLGGAVIGSLLDLSGTYYNPGGLGLIQDEAGELLMFSKVFHYPAISLKGIGASHNSVTDRTLAEAPTLIAGKLPLKGLGKHWLGYSYLNRYETKLALSGAWTGDFLPQQDIFEAGGYGAADLRLYEKLDEPWFGMTWAYKISDKIGVGITNYLAFRSHWISYRNTYQALSQEGQIRVANDLQEYRYNFVSLLWKIGLAYDLNRVTMGITLTTPRLKIYGDGQVAQNTTIIRYDPENPDYMAVNYRTGLQANYKSPFSLGAGLTYKLATTNLYATLEWFSGIGENVVIDGGDFISQSNGEKLPSRVTQKVDPVLNIALGVEQRLGRELTLYGSFWTDHSALKADAATSLSVVDWDLYHIMGGTTFTVLDSQLTLGLGYAFGSKKGDKRQLSEDPIMKDIIREYFSDMKYTYSSFKLVLGFSF